MVMAPTEILGGAVMGEHECKYADVIEDLRKNTADISKSVARIETAILGNGTKGLSDRVTDIEKENKERGVEEKKRTLSLYHILFTAFASGVTSLMVIYFAFRFWGIT